MVVALPHLFNDLLCYGLMLLVKCGLELMWHNRHLFGCCNGGIQLWNLLFYFAVTGHLLMALKAQNGAIMANHSLARADLVPSDHQLLTNQPT